MTSPRVTVLTAVRNGATHLAETIDSIRRQTFGDWEYVIVDDASDDETPGILAEAERSDDRIRVIRRNEAGGPFAAANEGLAVARGHYVVRTDADDVSVAWRIERQLEHLAAHPGLRACGSHWKVVSFSGRLDAQVFAVEEPPKVLKWRLCVRGGPPHSTLCVEREAFAELGGYRELPVAQDYRLLCELARRDWLGIVPEVLLFYRRHAGQLTATVNDLQVSLAIEALRDHLSALTSSELGLEEVAGFLDLQRSRASLLEGRRALRSWQGWWRADVRLTREDREALENLVTFARRRLRRSFLRGSALLAPARQARRIVMRSRAAGG